MNQLKLGNKLEFNFFFDQTFIVSLLNKPKMAYSRDLLKMAVWNYGLKLQLAWMTGKMDDWHDG